jgi:hypothetical protein
MLLKLVAPPMRKILSVLGGVCGWLLGHGRMLTHAFSERERPRARSCDPKRKAQGRELRAASTRKREALCNCSYDTETSITYGLESNLQRIARRQGENARTNRKNRRTCIARRQSATSARTATATRVLVSAFCKFGVRVSGTPRNRWRRDACTFGYRLLSESARQ